MAAPVLLSLSRRCRCPALFAARRLQSSSAVSKPPLHQRLLQYLAKHFYDMQMLLAWTTSQKQREAKKKNIYFGYYENIHGPNVAAGFFILTLNGGFRYSGHSDWYRAENVNFDFMNYKEFPLEEIDLSYTVINYDGFWNFVKQKSLRTLSLRGCPQVDGWFLSRLHIFQDSLEELDISHCPKITLGDLAALRNLKGLQRLDVSSLPALSNPGLAVILLEEMLPKCQVTADGYKFDLPAQEEEEAQREEMQR